MNQIEDFNRANQLYNKKNIIEALCYYKKLLNNKKCYYLYYNIGVCYIDLNNYQSAIDAFSNALFLNSYHVESYINLAYCYYKQKQYNKCYRIIKIGCIKTKSAKINNIENKLLKIVVSGG